MFVDPDDYVTPDFCETPYRDALREEADLVIFGYSRQQAVIRITLTDPGCLLSAGSLIRRRQCIMVVLLLGTSSTGGSCSISSAIRRAGSTRIWSRALTLLALAEPNDDPLFQQAEAVTDSIPGIPPQLKWKKKLMLLIWKLDKHLFHLACRLLGQKAHE